MNTHIDLDEDAGAEQPQVTPTPTPVEPADKPDVDEDAGDGEGLPENAVPNPDGSVTLTLLYPRALTVKKAGKTTEVPFASLTFHRLNGADQRAIAAVADAQALVVTFARSTRMVQARMNVLFDKLDMADIEAAGRILNGFLPSGRKTGKRG